MDTYRYTNGAPYVNEGGMRKVLFYFLNLYILQCPTDQPLERADRISKIRDLLRLRGLAQSALFWTKGHERSGMQNIISG
jgi:hypothetical protein